MGKGNAGGKRKQKDENKPKRSTSAYFYFMADCREKAKKEGRSLSKIAEFTKECSEVWGGMGTKERKCFDELAAKDKQRYEREMAIYTGKEAVDPNKPKKPQTAYFLFLADFRIRMKDTDIEHKEILKKAGEEWRALKDKQKEKYDKLAKEEAKKYDVAMENYRKGITAGPTDPPKKSKVEATNGTDEDDEEEDEEEEDDDEEDDEEDDE